MNFEESIEDAVKKTILKQIGDCRFIEYHHSRKREVPSDIVAKVWSNVNWDDVVKTITPQIQDRICKVIVENMLTEVKTDVKSVLSVDGVRQRIRMEVYPKLMKVLDDK